MLAPPITIWEYWLSEGSGGTLCNHRYNLLASCHCKEMAGNVETGILTVRRFCQQPGFRPIDFINQGKSQ